MHLRPAVICAFASALTAISSWGGGSGLNVAVIVNQNSSNSVQLANDYCEQRGVPPQNVLFLTNQWSGGSVYCATDEFQTNLVIPLLNKLQNENLANQIQIVLFSMDIPYQLAGSNGLNSTTSGLFYGFKPDTTPPAGLPVTCSLPDDSNNSYAFSELPFGEAPPNTAVTNPFLTVMLTDSNLAGAEMILQRGAASDSTFPSENVYLEKTDDVARNVRYSEFDNAIFDTRLRGGYDMSRTNSDSTSFTNLLGLETGLTSFTLPANAFAAGAMADDLTSYGGEIFTDSGQTPLLVFLEAGAAGSYGTVVEPCNYPQKFPNPLDYFYQARGFCMAEAYYLSVANPYQGLTVGEPLAAPFAQRGNGTWNTLPSGTAVLSGQTNLQLTFTAATANLPLDQVDLFVDGTWFETITNIPPGAGDRLSVALNGITNSYTVSTGDTLASIAGNLAFVLNQASNTTFVGAVATGDRIGLASLLPGVPGTDVTLDTDATNTAGAPTTFLTPAQNVFLDTIATGYHDLLINNAPAVGDWLQLTVTKTNGAEVILSVTNTTSGETIGQFVQSLVDEVNGAPALQTADGVYIGDLSSDDTVAEFNIYAQSPGWSASGIQATLNAPPDLVVQPAESSLLQDNLSDLQPRNYLCLASGQLSLPVRWTLDTTGLPDGYHELIAVAYEGTSVRTQTRAVQGVLIQNTPLSATLNTLLGGSNTDIGATLEFSVAANTGNVSAIQLFSTGGQWAVATNQSTAYFSIAGTNLGLGLHPFYVIVTDNAGHQYRTQTTWIRLIGTEPPITISISHPPTTLEWTSTAGRAYEILSATNLSGPFQIAATVTPSNSVARWVSTNPSPSAVYYRIETSY
jgi:uncharacterized protein (TIGR03790 family)